VAAVTRGLNPPMEFGYQGVANMPHNKRAWRNYSSFDLMNETVLPLVTVPFIEQISIPGHVLPRKAVCIEKR